MQKKLTITVDEAVYEELHRTVGTKRISKFIETLIKPHMLDTSLDDGYKAMAADREREKEAAEWCDALSGDITDETW